MGHSSRVPIINVLPQLFLDPWLYWDVRTSEWTGHSCEEALSYHLYSPPSIIQYYWDVKIPYSEMGCSVLSGKWVAVLYLLLNTK